MRLEIRLLVFVPVTYSHHAVYAPLETLASPKSKGQIMVSPRQGRWRIISSIFGKGWGTHSRKSSNSADSYISSANFERRGIFFFFFFGHPLLFVLRKKNKSKQKSLNTKSNRLDEIPKMPLEVNRPSLVSSQTSSQGCLTPQCRLIVALGETG